MTPPFIGGAQGGGRLGNVRNVPLGLPSYEDSIVNKIIIYNINK